MAKRIVISKGKKSLGSVDGNYKIHWAGFTRGSTNGPADIPYRVAGIGYMRLSGGKNLTGHQWSSHLPLEGIVDGFASTEWDLSGSYVVDGSDTIVATITFTPKSGAKPAMQDVIRMVPFDSAGRVFRFISTSPKDLSSNGLDELVTGEAVKVS